MLKHSISELAIFGGTPASEYELHSCRPYKDGKKGFQKLVDLAWETQRFTNNGPIVQLFEERVQNRLNVKHCLATSSGTSAMSLLLSSLSLTGEVIVPAFTFVSTAQILLELGLTPVFCDVDKITYTLDLGHLKSLISARTSAVIATHIWGRACDIDGLTELCNFHGLKLIFDAAHAFGCSYKGRPLGGGGVAEVFSFHATKILHTFEGGAITTNDASLAKDLATRRNFGFTDFDKVESFGTNAKMSEISAAMGVSGLESLEHRIERTKAIFQRYNDSLSGLRGFDFYAYNRSEDHHFHYIVANIGRNFGVSRDCLMQLLHAENIIARRYFYPGTDLLQPFADLSTLVNHRLPNTRCVCEGVLVLPGGSDITDQEIDVVCATIRYVSENAQEISEQLQERSSNAET